MEVFGNGGKFVMTNLLFPTEPYSTISISSLGGNARIEGLKVFSINDSSAVDENLFDLNHLLRIVINIVQI